MGAFLGWRAIVVEIAVVGKLADHWLTRLYSKYRMGGDRLSKHCTAQPRRNASCRLHSLVPLPTCPQAPWGFGSKPTSAGWPWALLIANSFNWYLDSKASRR